MNVMSKAERERIPPHARIRNAKRGSYDREQVWAVLDKGLVAHVGFIDAGRPMVIPMIYARRGDTLYIHGASSTRIIRKVGETAPLSLTVTLIDGLVVARAAFHNSVNYRCAIVHGQARHVTDPDELDEALTLLTDHLLPGRWAESRPVSAKERKATGVLALEVEEAATKVRTGGPVDDEEDYTLPIWAGVVPVVTALGQPLDDGRLAEGAQVPPSIAASRGRFL
ncbi:pyridoxamine 5'-phosphate oxidase family protein [Lutibaculum baratangense]|nr:pyridoxamine 5'-phosphate oxidase family protein [Lutibaculum baratangense]